MTYFDEIIVPILSMQITQVQAIVNIFIVLFIIFLNKPELKKSMMIGGLLGSFGIATLAFWIYNASGYLGAFVIIPWDGWFLIQAIENLVIVLILLPVIRFEKKEKWIALKKNK